MAAGEMNDEEERGHQAYTFLTNGQNVPSGTSISLARVLTRRVLPEPVGA